MKQQVDITLKLSLWLDAALKKDDIVTFVRASLPEAFGESLTAMKNPVDILEIREENETFHVPPDPERMNDNRSAWAAKALHAFMDETGAEIGDAVADLLCDLMHWCDRHNRPFTVELERARWHYDAETQECAA